MFNVAFQTILIKEIYRFMRIWTQTLLPPAITTALYFVIFGNLIGDRIGQMGGFDYPLYIAPGLIMMAVITNSYGNVVSSFFGSKYQKNIEEMMIAPLSNHTILCGFMMGGVARGLAVGVIVAVISMFFTSLQVTYWGVTVVVFILTAAVFSLAGLINAIFAKDFDDISIVPTFVLTPLTYLGGIFYSISLLSPFWHTISYANPILYMVNAFRFGMLGISDISIYWALSLLSLLLVILYSTCYQLLKHGIGLKK